MSNSGRQAGHVSHTLYQPHPLPSRRRSCLCCTRSIKRPGNSTWSGPQSHRATHQNGGPCCQSVCLAALKVGTEDGSRRVSGCPAFPDGQCRSCAPIYRLSAVDAQRQAATRAMQERHYYGQFTFRPAINPQSRRMAEVDHLRRSALTGAKMHTVLLCLPAYQ